MLVVERPRPEDAPKVARLAAEALQARLGDDPLAGVCLVARDVQSNEVVGFALAREEEGLDGHLVALAVDAHNRGMGIGSALLRAIGRQMMASGMRSIHLEVRADDLHTQQFYVRHGYAPTGLQTHVYPDGADAVTYRRPL